MNYNLRFVRILNITGRQKKKFFFYGEVSLSFILPEEEQANVWSPKSSELQAFKMWGARKLLFQSSKWKRTFWLDNTGTVNAHHVRQVINKSSNNRTSKTGKKQFPDLEAKKEILCACVWSIWKFIKNFSKL